MHRQYTCTIERPAPSCFALARVDDFERAIRMFEIARRLNPDVRDEDSGSDRKAGLLRRFFWALAFVRNLGFASLIALSACNEKGSTALPVVDAEGRTPDLVCPTSHGCDDAKGVLLIGASSRVVTPVVETFDDLNGDRRWQSGESFEDPAGDALFDPVGIAGFGHDRMAMGVHDELWARAIVFDKGGSRVALVAVDFVGYWHDEVVRVRRAARAQNLELDDVIIVSTHQHEGPDTMGSWGPDAFTSGKDEAYMRRVVDEIALALVEAVESLEPASIRVGQADASEWVADSRRPIVIDPTLTVLQATAGSSVIATLVVFGNHAEALGGENRMISSDYPHFLREALEDRYGGLAIYVPGTLGGLMNPLDLRGCPDANGVQGCENGTFEKAEWLGEGLAERVDVALERSSTIDDVALAFRRHSFLVTIENGIFVTGFFSGVLERTVFDREGQRLNAEQAASVAFEDALNGGLSIQTEVSAISIGPAELVFVPGEIYPELWLEQPDGTSFIERPTGADRPDAPFEAPIRPSLPKARFKAIVNQANDAIGYIIPTTQFDRDPPHAYEPDGQYGESNSIGPNAASGLRAAIDRLYDRTP